MHKSGAVVRGATDAQIRARRLMRAQTKRSGRGYAEARSVSRPTPFTISTLNVSCRRIGCLLVVRPRSGLRLRLLLQLLLLLFLRHVVADGATGCGTEDGVMAGDMSRHGTDSRAFEAALRGRGLRSDDQCEA